MYIFNPLATQKFESSMSFEYKAIIKNNDWHDNSMSKMSRFNWIIREKLKTEKCQFCCFEYLNLLSGYDWYTTNQAQGLK